MIYILELFGTDFCGKCSVGPTHHVPESITLSVHREKYPAVGIMKLKVFSQQIRKTDHGSSKTGKHQL